MIAASIVLVCAECLSPKGTLTRRAPWLVSFTFGLLHGMGFASALLEIGLPERHLPSALFSFNLGVELGQLAVIAAALTLRALIQRLRWQRPWMTRSLVYTMGSIAAFWAAGVRYRSSPRQRCFSSRRRRQRTIARLRQEPCRRRHGDTTGAC